MTWKWTVVIIVGWASVAAAGCAARQSDGAVRRDEKAEADEVRFESMSVSGPVLSQAAEGYQVTVLLCAPNPSLLPAPEPQQRIAVHLVAEDGRAVEGEVLSSTVAGSVAMRGRGVCGFPKVIRLEGVRQFVLTIGAERGVWTAREGAADGTVVFDRATFQRLGS